MEKLFNFWSVFTAVVGGAIVQLFGGFDLALKVLLIFIVCDYITGIIKGVYTKTLSSEIGFKGLLKKIVILIIVIVSATFQRLTNGVAIRETVIMFYIANEGISLLENASEFIPFPHKLKDILLQLRGDTDEHN